MIKEKDIWNTQLNEVFLEKDWKITKEWYNEAKCREVYYGTKISESKV